ncbi:MAG TPA: cytochrome c peroxidase [Chitinophagaceae bacterium]|nr:cytochrome c peroxidase [Chitinophagaceae bacterium]
MKFLIPASILLFLVSCKPDPSFTAYADDGHNHTHYNLNIPAGLPAMEIPADNPMSVEGVALGRKLFYDNILSANNTQNCGSCHQLGNYFVDSNKQFSTGVDNIQGTRNSMPLFNIGYAKRFFWDGGAANLESQVIGPITNPIEMHETMENVINKLQSHPQYPTLFKAAFGTDIINSKMIMQAVAQFERTLISANSKFDKWKRGEVSLTAQEELGMNLYQSETKGDCVHCHSLGSTFTDFEFRNTGLDSIPVDKGRALITFLKTDEGKFKTPTLRNIEMTSPYMHDGRFTTLRECVQHYNKNFKYTENLAAELKNLPKNRLNESEVDAIIAFLLTLTDHDFINNPNFDKP